MKKQILLTDKYVITNKLGSGSFGDVYLANDAKGKEYAIKAEKKNDDCDDKLYSEYKIYNSLTNKGFNENSRKYKIPKIYDFLKSNEYNLLVMQCLGNNLDNWFEKYDKKFNLGTVLKLGYVITSMIENLHENGYIHRDIKPTNFMTGKHNNRNTLYLLDFGLTKKYINNGKHIHCKFENSLIGTARYASINVHIGIEPSRRDDLESVGYMLIYFLKGVLPWQGLQKNKGSDKYKMIREKKILIEIDELCGNLPQCFADYIIYCRSLQYNEKPNYSYLKKLFINTSKKMNIEMKYEWS